MVQATTQLPRNARPSHYAIEVTPHADKMAFDGKVKISIDVLEPTSTIVLQAVNMTFANSTPSIRLVRLPDNRWIELSIAPVTGTITETTGG